MSGSEEDLDDDFFSFDNFKEEPYSEFELWDEQFKEQRKLDDIPNPYADGDDGVSGMPDEF